MKNKPYQRYSQPSRDGGATTYAYPRRVVFAILWVAWLTGLLMFYGVYHFADPMSLRTFVWNVFRALPLWMPLLFFFVTSTVLLFSWRPLLAVSPNSICFPLIGFGIQRDNVRRVVAQGNGITDNWRVIIELKKASSGHYRVWLFYPAVYAFRDTIYILPMFLAQPRLETKERIVSALEGERN